MAPVGAPNYVLRILTHAGNDLKSIASENPVAHAHLVALLNELKDSPELLPTLLDNRYGQDSGKRDVFTYGVEIIGEFKRHRPRRDIWRIKTWDPDDHQTIPYRIIYTYIPKKRWFVVLAIVERSWSNNEWNYEFSHPLTNRIVADHDRLHREYG